MFPFAPDRSATIYAADMEFMGRIARKVVTVARDLGSVNQVIAEEIQDHFSRTKAGRRGKASLDGNSVINKALAGGLDLSSRLTQLEQGFADSRAAMHLDPANLRRVVDTALQISHQPTLVVAGDDRTDAAVFTVPALSPAWQSTLTGLDTRSEPGVLRPITFDDQAAAGRKDLVYVHLGHPLVKKAQRLLRRSLWSADAPLHRVTAVVVNELEESFVAAVARMVLVGRGGLRLHEEIFLAGVRLRGRRAIAEERAEQLLDQALDADRLTLAASEIRTELTREWNEPESPLRTRLLDSMTRRADTRHQRVSEQLAKRQSADVSRAQEIFAAFRRNLNESLDQLTSTEMQTQLALFPDDQQRQRRRDIDTMRRRLDELTDEETREVAAITERYSDVKPHTTAAAVVFALTPADARRGGTR